MTRTLARLVVLRGAFPLSVRSTITQRTVTGISACVASLTADVAIFDSLRNKMGLAAVNVKHRKAERETLDCRWQGSLRVTSYAQGSATQQHMS